MASKPTIFAAVLGVIGLFFACGNEASSTTVSLEPCSVLIEEEASAMLKSPVKRDVPSPIKYKGVSTGGTCLYRSQKDSNKTITVRTDATPTGAQKR